MPSPPRCHDPEPHVRVGREPRPLPVQRGVALLLAQQRGRTELSYPCAEGRVGIELGWRLASAELGEVDEAVHLLASAPASRVMQAVAELFRCEVTWWVVELVEVRGREEGVA